MAPRLPDNYVTVLLFIFLPSVIDLSFPQIVNSSSSVFTLSLLSCLLFQWKNKNEERVFMISLSLILAYLTSPHLTSCQPPSPPSYCKKGQTLDLHTRHHLLLPTPGNCSITTPPFTTFCFVFFFFLFTISPWSFPSACEYDKKAQSLNSFSKLCLLKLLTLNTISEFIMVKFKFLLQASTSIQIWIFHGLFSIYT